MSMEENDCSPCIKWFRVEKMRLGGPSNHFIIGFSMQISHLFQEESLSML